MLSFVFEDVSMLWVAGMSSFHSFIFTDETFVLGLEGCGQHLGTYHKTHVTIGINK